jgi:uncharacterized repeat protein (TIGR01451 family)
MIHRDTRKIIAIAAIAVLVLLAAVPLSSAIPAPTLIFEDDFESGNLDKWFNVLNSVDVTNDSTYAPTWGGYYARFSFNDSAIYSGIIAKIDTSCKKNISLSFARRTVNLTGGVQEFFTVRFYNGTDWQLIAGYSDNKTWENFTYPLPVTADDNPDLRIRFLLTNADPGEYAFLDNVTVTGEQMSPALEVNKTVYDPVNETWVKELTAKINDTLQFTSTITNTGNINLTQIRFWDVLDCSLNFSGNATLNSNPIALDGDYIFKPKVLHNTSWALDNPVGTEFTELCPGIGIQRHLLAWEDTNEDGNVSACDQVWLTSPGELWYHVDRVPYTLTLNETDGGLKYFDSVLDWDEVILTDPNETKWLGVCCCKDRYTLIGWAPRNCAEGGISAGDNVTMRNERTGEEVQYTVEEEVAIDLVVSREYEIDDYLPELTQLEPEETITIVYNATVVRCGVDNNTFRAKGMGCGDNWTYSDPDVVTITVPCPSGDAADGTPAIKDVFTAGEPVYALGRNFAPNKNVSIYITPVRTWAFGDIIADYKIVGPVNTTTDANGNIGINPKVLMWPDPVPGQYHMVFDDPDVIYEPGVDLYDLFEVIGVAVPVVTPLGLVALIGLLSIVATSTLLKKRKRR